MNLDGVDTSADQLADNHFGLFRRSRMDLVAAQFGGMVRIASFHGTIDCDAGNKHAWSPDPAFLDCVSLSNDPVRGIGGIIDGGNAKMEEQLRHPRREVNMAVNQSGKDCLAIRADHLC